MKPNYSKKIRELLEEINTIAARNLPAGKSHQISNRTDKIKTTINAMNRRGQILQDEAEPAAPGETAKERILAALRSGAQLSSRQADIIGKTSQGNQIITRLRRAGESIGHYTAHNDKGHVYNIYYLENTAN